MECLHMVEVAVAAAVYISAVCTDCRATRTLWCVSKPEMGPERQPSLNA
jgi:hypothetical protein